MLEKKRINYTKKDISKNLILKIGLSELYSSLIVNDLIHILKELIKLETVNIKNFGTFKVLFKQEREGRNPKDKKSYKISARKTLSFIASKKISVNLNNR
tara:strand:+ start:280 stop:579 length:300 start_codon:yes stop_codon:yes gene_type:complete